MKKIKCILAMLILSQALFAMTGLEVATAHDEKEKPDTTHMLLQMDLIEESGKTASRVIEQWGADKDELANSIMVFRTPASVKNTRFLQVENSDRGDDKWIYLPALKRVRRIASSEGSKSFMGSDLSYDDMETRDLERDTFELIKEETIDSWDCYVVKGQAVDSDDSQYAYRLTWFDNDTFVPVKIEMYDKKNELLKVVTVKSLQNVNGFWTPMDTVIKNVQSGHSTNMKVLKVEFDKPVNPRMFTTQFLSNGR